MTEGESIERRQRFRWRVRCLLLVVVLGQLYNVYDLARSLADGAERSELVLWTLSEMFLLGASGLLLYFANRRWRRDLQIQ